MKTKIIEPLIDTAEVARLLEVSERTIRNWVDSCGLPAYRLGGLLRFKQGEVADWIEEARIAQIHRDIAGLGDDK